MATRKKQRPEASEASLRRYDEKFLDCREVHFFLTVGWHKTDDGYVQRTRICTRCGTVCKDKLDTYGDRVTSRRYQWPEGYKLDGVVPRVRIRAESLRRAKVYPSEAAMIAAMTVTTRKKLRYPINHAAKRSKVGAK